MATSSMHLSSRVRYVPLYEWECIFDDGKRLKQVLDYIRNFKNKYEILPYPKYVFNVFRMLRPESVKVVFIGQSPYPGVCPATGIPYAFGPAFMPNPKCATTPATLKQVLAELCRDLGKTHLQVHPHNLIMHWISQGVLLLNASLTLGVRCPKHLENHSVLWEEVMRNIIFSLSSQIHPIFVLIGSDAWKLSECIVDKQIIKVSHPVARSKTQLPWIGSGVFTSVSKMMVEKGMLPIKWIPTE